MQTYSELVSLTVFSSVMVCWFVFAAAFLFRKKTLQAKEQKRERSFVVGIVLQAVGYAAIWTFRRPMFTPIAALSAFLETTVAVITVVLAVVSMWVLVSAVLTLGKQWSIAARIVEGHTLVAEGPYRLMRHPIYSGMFGMLLATGLAMSYWWAVAPGAVIFWLGTRLRVRSEEKLLLETFGKEYEDYARRVPALLPRLTRR